jgi:hypothetical protein
MITTIEINTALAKSSEALLEAAKEHPLYQGSFSGDARGGSSNYTIAFGKGGLEFARFTFTRGESGPLVLRTVKGNLPCLLWGHEGRLIQIQDQLELALTRLRWLGSGLVTAADTCLLLPHPARINTGFITELGLAIQVDDIFGRLFNAGRFSTVNGSAMRPFCLPGHTILLGENVTWDIRSVIFKGGASTLGPLTRLECRIRDSHLLAKAIRVKYTDRYLLAALPFEYLSELFERATKETLGGGLAALPTYRSNEFADAVRRVMRQSHNPEAFKLALQLEQIGMTADRADKLRRRVYREISTFHKVCLYEELMNGDLDHKRREAPSPDVEFAHAGIMKSIGCPDTPDETTCEAFCGPLLRDRLDPHQRLFFNLEAGLPY